MNLNISYNWLKEYIKTDLSAVDFAKKISLHGPSVDRIYEQKPDFEKVVTGEILEINDHPNADKLHVCRVSVGKEELQIVCGAPNIQVGQIVPVVMVGGKVQGFEIKAAKLRGVESFGMMCSTKELGLGEDQSGIFILPTNTKIGQPLEKVLSFDDAVMDMEVTSNRPDAMSIVGIAREASAILGAKNLWKMPSPDLKAAAAKKLSVKNSEGKLCPRYQAIVMDGVKVGPSPLWMQQRLMSAGIRAINNLVDITNYILLEYGQPMHVFDYDKLQGGKINVRLAEKGEKILALDGKEYELTENNLVIADAKDPVAVAGVMGGELSAATSQTVTIVLESANFNPISVRKTARGLNLHSESSSLYEKGLSPENTTPALLRAIELVQQLAGGKVSSEIFDEKKYKLSPKQIKLDPANVARVLGVEIKLPRIKEILESLGFAVEAKVKEFKVAVPWWREGDVEGEHDLIEEIARIYGYHELPAKLMEGEIPVAYDAHDEFYFEDKAKAALVGLGYSENYNYSFVSENLLADCGFDPAGHVRISNPLSADYEYMRSSLLPSLMQSYADNAPSYDEVKAFELSRVYMDNPGALPTELTRLAMLCAKGDDEQSFLELKGALQSMMSKLHVSDYSLEAENSGGMWRDGVAISIKAGETEIGRMGLIDKGICAKLGIKKPFAVSEIDFPALMSVAKTTPAYVPIPKFPAIELDLSMEVDHGVLFGQIAASAKGIDELIRGVEFLSVYEGDKVAAGKKALAIRVVYRRDDRTLELAEAQKIHEKVVDVLKKEYNITVR